MKAALPETARRVLRSYRRAAAASAEIDRRAQEIAAELGWPDILAAADAELAEEPVDFHELATRRRERNVEAERAEAEK